VEHQERPDDPAQEIKADLDELDEQGEQMDEGTDELQRKTDDVSEEFERKRDSSDVPGAQ